MAQQYADSKFNMSVAVPDIVMERCVHTRIEQSSCCACAEACPRGAWVIDDEMLGIDSDLCDGCDLCVPACPESVLLQRFLPAIWRVDGVGIALAYCTNAGLGADRKGIMPCVHALSTLSLLRLHQQGATEIVLGVGNCAACPRQSKETLDQRVAEINRLLDERGLSPLNLGRLDKDAWERMIQRLEDPAAVERSSRRGFFRTLVQTPIKRLDEALQSSDTVGVPVGTLLPRSEPGQRLPCVPVLDAVRCSGCDSCIQLCPHEALSLGFDKDSNPLVYRTEPERCTGCGICIDVCETEAIEVRRWACSGPEEIPLRRSFCQACGAPYHVPETNGPGSPKDGLCRICQQTNHHRNLFQVID